MDAGNPHRIPKKKTVISIQRCQRNIAARRLGIDIGFYENTGTDSKHLMNLDTYYLTVLNKINII